MRCVLRPMKPILVVDQIFVSVKGKPHGTFGQLSSGKFTNAKNCVNADYFVQLDSEEILKIHSSTHYGQL